MDLLETGDHFVLRADLPGVGEDDVKIELEDSTLTISGERKAEHAAEGEGFYRVERATGAFQRSLTLPKGVDPEAVSASFDRGVLEVRIPKPSRAQAAPDLDRRLRARRRRGQRGLAPLRAGASSRLPAPCRLLRSAPATRARAPAPAR